MQEEQERSRLDKFGREVLDTKPVALPVGFKHPPSLAEQIRRLVRNELSARASEVGHETFDEADDFDVGDDYDPKSPYEVNFDQELNLENDRNAVKQHKTMDEQVLNVKSKEPKAKGSPAPLPESNAAEPRNPEQDSTPT